MTFSEAQQITLSITVIGSSFLSMCGSSAIIYTILNDWARKRRKTYHRILLAMSFIDFLASVNYATSSFLMPEGTPNVWMPIGTKATCNLQGFLSQIGIASTMLTASLAIYFWRAIQQTSPRKSVPIPPRLECFMIGSPIIFSIGTAIAGILMGIYHPPAIGIGCWIAEFPVGCNLDDQIECEYAKNAVALRWYFGGTWVILSLAIVVCCMIAICWSLWKQLRTIESRYDFGQESQLRAAKYRLRQSAIQACLYIGTFILMYIWQSAARSLENRETRAGERAFFAVSLLSQIFFPLQGFFNFFIYVRPIYCDYRRRFPDATYRQIWKRIFRKSTDPYPRFNRSHDSLTFTSKRHSQESKVSMNASKTGMDTSDRVPHPSQSNNQYETSHEQNDTRSHGHNLSNDAFDFDYYSSSSHRPLQEHTTSPKSNRVSHAECPPASLSSMRDMPPTSLEEAHLSSEFFSEEIAVDLGMDPFNDDKSVEGTSDQEEELTDTDADRSSL